MTDIHKHCPVCSTPIPMEETTCSSKCQDTLDNKQAQVNKGKNIVNIIMVIFLVVAVIFFISQVL